MDNDDSEDTVCKETLMAILRGILKETHKAITKTHKIIWTMLIKEHRLIK